MVGCVVSIYIIYILSRISYNPQLPIDFRPIPRLGHQKKPRNDVQARVRCCCVEALGRLAIRGDRRGGSESDRRSGVRFGEFFGVPPTMGLMYLLTFTPSK